MDVHMWLSLLWGITACRLTKLGLACSGLPMHCMRAVCVCVVCVCV
jgi:hypothetical protein